MKKIYLSLTGLILCGSVIGQSAFNIQPRTLREAVIDPNTIIHPVSSPNADRTTTFRMWVEPVGDVMYCKGGITFPPTANCNQSLYLDVVYMDSTVRVGDAAITTEYVSTPLLGSVLDPKSTNLQSSHLPIITRLDAYNIDSLAIYGSYMKKTASIDTLYTWLVWGDTANTAVFANKLDAAVWGAPVSTWRHSIIGPMIAGASTAQGNKVKAAAPSSNCILFKRVLTNSDSVGAFGHAKNIKIKLLTPAAIPAGNIVSCFYTFVPGGTQTAGSYCFSFPGAANAQTINGFAGIVWGQSNPAVTTSANYVNQQVDPSSWCMGASYGSSQRYNQAGVYSTFMTGDLLTAPYISYSIYGNTTTGISELEKNGFALGQNIPNPATNLTTINYQLNKAASTMAFEIYDIRGVKVFEKTQTGVQQGKYSVELNSVNYPAGIYFYSLTVDGNKITKKMVVSK